MIKYNPCKNIEIKFKQNKRRTYNLIIQSTNIIRTVQSLPILATAMNKQVYISIRHHTVVYSRGKTFSSIDSETFIDSSIYFLPFRSNFVQKMMPDTKGKHRIIKPTKKFYFEHLYVFNWHISYHIAINTITKSLNCLFVGLNQPVLVKKMLPRIF